MSAIKINRIRLNPGMDGSDRKSIDEKLQLILQEMVDHGVTIISIQQTAFEYVQKNAPDTYVKWAEFLIISSIPQKD